MPSPLSVDLRERVVAAVAEGASFHRAAARFGVSVSSVSRWSQRFAQQGHVLPKPTHGDDSLPAIEVHADLILSLDEAQAELLPRRVARRPGRARRADQHERAVTLLRSPRDHP